MDKTQIDSGIDKNRNILKIKGVSVRLCLYVPSYT